MSSIVRSIWVRPPSAFSTFTLLLFAFFKPRVLGAHGGAGYTFGALALHTSHTQKQG